MPLVWVYAFLTSALGHSNDKVMSHWWWHSSCVVSFRGLPCPLLDFVLNQWVSLCLSWHRLVQMSMLDPSRGWVKECSWSTKVHLRWWKINPEHALLVEVSDVFFKYKVYIHCYSLYILSKFLPKPEQKNNNPHFKIIFPYYLRTKSSSYRISFYLPQASICCSICVFDWHIYCLRIWQFYHLK